MSESILCNKLTVKQGVKNGCLGGPYSASVKTDDDTTITVSQLGERTIEISTSIKCTCEDLFARFQSFEKFLMIFDGGFLELEELTFANDHSNDKEALSEKAKELSALRLGCFTSRDFCHCSFLKLIRFQDIVSENLYASWKKLLEQMDISFQVLLYSLSDNRNPVDMNFAFIVELSEPIVELVKESTYLCETLNPGERGTTLRMCLDTLITHFGTDIFENELNNDYKTFLDYVVGSRVRIMHIKKNQDKHYDGKECIRYSMKFSLLYRRIFFELLDISYDLYKDNLLNAINNIDKW